MRSRQSDAASGGAEPVVVAPPDVAPLVVELALIFSTPDDCAMPDGVGSVD